MSLLYTKTMAIGGAPPVLIEITPTVAERIYRVLVAFADARPEQRLHFMHHMSETGTGLDQDEWRLNAGRYGATCFFICDNEWIVTTTQDDLTPRTQVLLDTTNLELALLKDIILAGG